MHINKPVYLFLGIIAAASVVTAGGFATPVLASTGGETTTKNILDATNIHKKVMSMLTLTTLSNTKITGTIAGIMTTTMIITMAGDTSSLL